MDKKLYQLEKNNEFSWNVNEFENASEQICESKDKDAKEKKVASVRLFSDPTHVKESNKILGIPIPVKRGRHSFITIENISSENIYIDKIELPPSNTISLGVYSEMKTKEHSGLWVGMECRNVHLSNLYAPRVSLRCDITQKQIENLAVVLRKFYHGWNYYKNCAYFARTIWNSVSTVKIKKKPLDYPLSIYQDIMETQKQAYAYPIPFDFYVYYMDNQGKPCKSRFWNRKWDK